MKTVCDFCKTEYCVDPSLRGPVKCAVCGHAWMLAPASRRNAWMTFIAAATAALAAVVFSVVVITRHNVAAAERARPLVATITGTDTVIDAAGVPHFVVSGRIVNRSAEIYGVPDLVIVSYDANDKEIDRQKFMPSATLLDAGGAVDFTHTLSSPAAGVKKITAEIKYEMD